MSPPTQRDKPHARARIAYLLEHGAKDGASRYIDLTLMSLISLSVAAIILESVESIRAPNESLFLHFEMVIVAIFSFEILVRLWCAPEVAKYAHDGQTWRARLRYLISPMAIIDVAAVLPYYLTLFGWFDDTNLLVLRSVRSVRLLRVLKLTRYSESFTLLINVIIENLRSLAAAIFLLNVVMLLAACGIYVFEHEAQPEAFGSIPAAMWWAFATLTTVGYGDVVPITTAGRVFGASITVVGLGMVALPTAILASAFSERLRIRSQRYREQMDVALEDGVLTADEIELLQKLQHKLGLGDGLVNEITNRAIETPDAEICPYCQPDTNEHAHPLRESA